MLSIVLQYKSYYVSVVELLPIVFIKYKIGYKLTGESKSSQYLRV